MHASPTLRAACTGSEASTTPSTDCRRTHKRRRSDVQAAAACSSVFDDDFASDVDCATSEESSADETDGVEAEEIQQESEAKRRRRADLDGLKKSVRRMEAQVLDASAQIRDLRALVAQVVIRRQQGRA